VKVKHSLILFLCSLFVISFFLVGCSNNSTVSKKTQSSTSGAAKAGTQGQPLIIVASPNGNWQENFNPFSTNSLGGTNGLIYQPLFYFSTVSHDVYPFLGTKYEWVNNNKTLEVTLRNSVKWSDGQPFTSEDVLFTFNLLKKYPAADLYGIMKVVKSVVKKNDNSVDFNFDQPNIPFQEYILQQLIVPQHIWKNFGDPSKESMTKPIGTGPYVLENFTPQEYKLKKNDSYFAADQYAVPELDFPAYNSAESTSLAMAKGDIDWAGLFIPDIKKIYTSKSKDNHFWFPPGAPVVLYPNLKNPALNDVNVRKAISLAINRDKITKQSEYGYAQIANPTGILPRDKDFINPKYGNLSFNQDLAGAAKILADAGYKKGSDGILVSPSGKKISFTLQVVSGWSDWVTTCSLISQDLEKIGIEVKVQQQQYGAYISNLQNGKYDLAISWTNGGSTPYKTFQDLLNVNGGWNVEKWSNPKTDAALDTIKSTTDVSKQKEAFSIIEDVMVNQLPAIPLFYGPTWYEYSTAKYTGFASETNPYAGPSPFSWPAPAVVLSKLKPVNK
jgi:peptide/nickel transport system substrate-binding protein